MVVYNKPGRLVVSFAHPTRNEGSGVGTRGACAEPLGHKRERWWVIEMTITSSMNTFSNTGNIPTLHQPTVTVITVTHTGYPQWLIHITCLKFGLVPTHTTYCKTLQNALGMKTVNARENVSLGMYICIIYQASWVLLLHHFYVFLFFVLRQLCGICHGV